MFLVDWFSVSSKADSLKSIIDLLGLTKIAFEEINGFYGYLDSLFYNGIRIHYNGRTSDMGILVEMSGTGCRAFETYSTTDFNSLFIHVNENKEDYNVTRLDVAFDDKEGIVPIKQLEHDTRNENFISKFRKWGIEETSDGDTVYQGSKKSDIMLRIYDKAAERSLENFHWVRVELQLRQNRAIEFISQFISGTSLGDMFCGVLYNYIRYVTPCDNPRKDRWKMRKYWQKLINNAVKVKLFTRCDLEYNLENLHNFVVKQAGGAVKTYIDILGYDKLEQALEERKTPLNLKYQRLIADNKNFKFDEIGSVFDD